MSYFNQIPNLEYISPFESTTNSDYIKSKNIFLRAKVRDGILKNIAGIQDYYIRDGERPDTIAERIYGDSELDWVILITNNITNLNNQWPLDNQSFYKYLIDKYETEENIYSIHHYETIGIQDQYSRTVLNQGYEVDYGFTRSFTTEEGISSYSLLNYQDSNLDTSVRLNLNQFLEIPGRNYTLKVKINDIEVKNSTLYIKGRNTTYDINITNSLSPWPSGWGGKLSLNLRDGETYEFNIGDEVGDTYITLPPYLYELVRSESNNQVETNFVFLPQE